MTDPITNILTTDTIFVVSLLWIAIAILQALKSGAKTNPWTRRAIRGSLFVPCARYSMTRSDGEKPCGYE
ncbi:hypothetical protein DWB85_16340 [Seongchinamella sediminis]|uniref:Uncharacterized protein n=1 Tax=Seongchinamella sediminis TaxID=2283635 RepID=A0A3L7DT25_9GAMM|nr:hypothetical protein DWB85_16340 [Seongchinamella sediminis]